MSSAPGTRIDANTNSASSKSASSESGMGNDDCNESESKSNSQSSATTSKPLAASLATAVTNIARTSTPHLPTSTSSGSSRPSNSRTSAPSDNRANSLYSISTLLSASERVETDAKRHKRLRPVNTDTLHSSAVTSSSVSSSSSSSSHGSDPPQRKERTSSSSSSLFIPSLNSSKRPSSRSRPDVRRASVSPAFTVAVPPPAPPQPRKPTLKRRANSLSAAVIAQIRPPSCELGSMNRLRKRRKTAPAMGTILPLARARPPIQNGPFMTTSNSKLQRSHPPGPLTSALSALHAEHSAVASAIIANATVASNHHHNNTSSSSSSSKSSASMAPPPATIPSAAANASTVAALTAAIAAMKTISDTSTTLGHTTQMDTSTFVHPAFNQIHPSLQNVSNQDFELVLRNLIATAGGHQPPPALDGRQPIRTQRVDVKQSIYTLGAPSPSPHISRPLRDGRRSPPLTRGRTRSHRQIGGDDLPNALPGVQPKREFNSPPLFVAHSVPSSTSGGIAVMDTSAPGSPHLLRPYLPGNSMYKSSRSPSTDRQRSRSDAVATVPFSDTELESKRSCDERSASESSSGDVDVTPVPPRPSKMRSRVMSQTSKELFFRLSEFGGVAEVLHQCEEKECFLIGFPEEVRKESSTKKENILLKRNSTFHVGARFCASSEQPRIECSFSRGTVETHAISLPVTRKLESGLYIFKGNLNNEVIDREFCKLRKTPQNNQFMLRVHFNGQILDSVRQFEIMAFKRENQRMKKIRHEKAMLAQAAINGAFPFTPGHAAAASAAAAAAGHFEAATNAAAATMSSPVVASPTGAAAAINAAFSPPPLTTDNGVGATGSSRLHAISEDGKRTHGEGCDTSSCTEACRQQFMRLQIRCQMLENKLLEQSNGAVIMKY